jgi:hypothetical protein
MEESFLSFKATVALAMGCCNESTTFSWIKPSFWAAQNKLAINNGMQTKIFRCIIMAKYLIDDSTETFFCQWQNNEMNSTGMLLLVQNLQ